MKKLVPLLAAVALAVTGVAGPFIGFEAVPVSNPPSSAIYYMTFGWTGTMTVVGTPPNVTPIVGTFYAGVMDPLIPFNSWWSLRGGVGVSLTNYIDLYGVVSMWTLIEDMQITSGLWAFGLGLAGKVTPAFTIFATGNLARPFSLTTPLFGLWMTFGFTFQLY